MSNDRGSDNDRDETGEGGTGRQPGGEIQLSVDAMITLLAQRERRQLMEWLQEIPGNSCSFEEVIKHLVDERAKQTGERPSYDNVQAKLQHVHLPKLADAGVIEYDVRSNTIRYTGHEELEALLDLIQGFERDHREQE